MGIPVNFIVSFANRNKLFLVYIIVITWWCSLRCMAWMLAMLLPIVIIYQLGKLGIFWKDILKRKDRFVAFAVIVVSLLVVVASHTYQHWEARSAANKIVADIITFNKTNGRYPVDDKELGITDLTRKQLYRVNYKAFEGKPSFSYAVTYVLFRKWEYDFFGGTWNVEYG